LWFAERHAAERQSDTAWIDEQSSLDHAEELNVSVAAEQEGLLTTAEQPQQLLLGRGCQDHVVEGRRRAVKTEDRSAVNVKLDSLLKRAYVGPILGRQLSRPPLALLEEASPRLPLHLREAVEDPGIPIAHDNPAAQGTDSAKRFRWLRPERDISEAKELIDLLALELRDNFLQRRQIAVDV
jgi:hypothetical protein